MTRLTVAGRLLTASADSRVLTYLLLPYGEVGRTNLGRVTATAGCVDVPEDPTTLVANLEHDPTRPVGRFVTLDETDAGLTASVRVLPTTAGDDLLIEAAEGVRTGISVEIDAPVIRDGALLAGTLTGAGFVTSPAFPSAQLAAADTGDLPDELGRDSDYSSRSEETIEVDGVRYRRVYETTSTSTTTRLDETAEDPTPEETTMPPVAASAEPTETTAPATLAASARPAATTRPAGGIETAADLYAALARNHQAGRTPASLLAALDNAIQTDVVPAQQPAWLGEVWAARTYRSRFAPLLSQAKLSALKATGWKFTSGKTPAVDTYAGFPTQPNSNEVKTEAVTVTAARIAGAGAIDRAFVDFSTPEFWAGYYRECTNSYARQLDAAVLAHLLTATNHTAVEAGTVPSGVSTAAAYIVDGATAILDVAVPTFAIVGSDLYRELLLTKRNDAIEYLSIALGIEDGSLEQFAIVPSSDEDLAGKVLVGAGEAATVFQLPGSPVRIDTVNIATGGVETGVFGYHAEFTGSASAFALVEPEDVEG